MVVINIKKVLFTIHNRDYSTAVDFPDTDCISSIRFIGMRKIALVNSGNIDIHYYYGKG